MTGVDIPLPELQTQLHQPTIKEISYIGEKDFLIGIQCLCINKTMLVEDEALLAGTTNFQIFMTVMNDKSTADKKNSVLMALQLLFPKYQIFLTPRAISMNSDAGNVIIDEGNFEKLQQIIGQIFCLSKTDATSFNPQGKKAKEIADKLMRARQRVAAQKQGSMSLGDCLNLTVYQMYDLVERYSLYINWDIDLKSRLAGAKPDKPVDNWMKQIH